MPSCKRQAVRTVCAMAALCGLIFSGSRPASAFAPGRSTPSQNELSRVEMPEDEYVESLTYVMYLSDGGRVESSFQVTNFGIGKGNGGFNAQVILGDKSVQLRNQVKHNFRWESSPLAIEMGKDDRALRLRTLFGVAGQAGHTVEISANAPDFSFRMEVKSLASAWRPGSGRVDFSGRQMNYIIQVPRADVQGEITAFGKHLAVTGIGYMEHGRTNVDPRRLTDRQLRLRFFEKNGGKDGEKPLTVLSFDQTTPQQDGARRFGFVGVWSGDKLIYENITPVLEPRDLKPDPKRAQNLLPARFEIGVDGVKVNAQVKRMIERSDYLDTMSAFLRSIVKHFVHPISYNYDCEAEVAVNVPSLQTKRSGWADCGATLTRP